MKTIYVVASKVKQLIKSQDIGGFTNFNTSAEAIDVLSQYNEAVIKEATKFAQAEGRKTVMKRDMEMVFGSSPLITTSTSKQKSTDLSGI